jgi:hypothetical protein
MIARQIRAQGSPTVGVLGFLLGVRCNEIFEKLREDALSLLRISLELSRLEKDKQIALKIRKISDRLEKMATDQIRKCNHGIRAWLGFVRGAVAAEERRRKQQKTGSTRKG